MKINKKTYTIGALALITTLVGGTSAFAETTNINDNQGTHLNQIRKGDINGMMRPVVVGKVTAISGNTITITKQSIEKRNSTTTTPTATTTTFTIDATNAKIEKGGTAGTITSIVVGDTIMVQGAVTGTNVVATDIRDGIIRGTEQNKTNGNKNIDQQIPTNMQGNGLPVIAGSVTSISGNSIVITNKSNVTYTIDTTTAKIIKGQNTATITNITIGDQVLAQGTINGNNVIATSIYDQTNVVSAKGTPKAKGFFDRIGSFFGGLFGF